MSTENARYQCCPKAWGALNAGSHSTLFNARVSAVAIRSTGALKIYFRGGPKLEVDADATYEAWQLASSTMGLLFVCSPGGAVSLFKDR